MSFPILRSVLRTPSGLDTGKLVLIAAGISRPALRAWTRAILRPMFHEGELRIRYRDCGRRLTVFLRDAELQTDFQGFREVVSENVYPLDPSFRPDLIVDGGGNIGLFTLHAAACFPDAPRIICEPVPANAAQIRKHLQVNDVAADLRAVCLGGKTGEIPFYVREANSGSFDSSKPYDHRIDVPVTTLAEVTAGGGKDRLLIKLDIEGMEMEVLQAYVPGESRAVVVLGELHDHRAHKPALEELMARHNWEITFGDLSAGDALFKARSPRAVQDL